MASARCSSACVRACVDSLPGGPCRCATPHRQPRVHVASSQPPPLSLVDRCHRFETFRERAATTQEEVHQWLPLWGGGGSISEEAAFFALCLSPAPASFTASSAPPFARSREVLACGCLNPYRSAAGHFSTALSLSISVCMCVCFRSSSFLLTSRRRRTAAAPFSLAARVSASALHAPHSPHPTLARRYMRTTRELRCGRRRGPSHDRTAPPPPTHESRAPAATGAPLSTRTQPQHTCRASQHHAGYST